MQKKTTGAQFSLGSRTTLNMRVLGGGSCSAQEDGEEEEAEKGGGKGTGNQQKKPSKLQTSWNNLSRQKERGQSKAGEASARNGPMKKDLCAAARQKKKKMLTLSERGPVAQRHNDKQSAVNPF